MRNRSHSVTSVVVKLARDPSRPHTRLTCGCHVTTAIPIVAVCFVSSLNPVKAQEADATIAAQAVGPQDEGVTFSGLPIDQVRTELLDWLTAAGATEEVIQRVTRQWSSDQTLASLSREELLDQLVQTFAEADPATRRLVHDSYGPGPLQSVIFDRIREMPIYRNQVQQFQARWLAQHRFYDEALPLLTELIPDDQVDPAGLLFYRSICQAELLQRREALDSISLLLNNTLDVPERFRVVAKMLHKQLADQKDEGLDKVAQLMKDVERRLNLGRSGEKTQEQEDAVIAAFDELLEKLDQQNQQQQQNGGGGGGSQQDQQGANQSRIKGSAADGEADRKELTKEGKWGMVDKKAEARARELIRSKFPPNFLDQIGRYTKKLAEQKK